MNSTFFHIFSILLLFFFSPLPPPLHAANQKIRIKIGVRAHSGDDVAMEKWSATADYLSKAIEGYQFEMVPMSGFSEMEEAVRKNSVQFVLTNPAAYADLEYQQAGLARIATLINGRGDQATKQFGGVIFSRSDRKDITTLADIKGKSIMGVHRKAFGGWWMALGELKEHGIDPAEDCSGILFGVRQEPVVIAVKEGRVDVGTVRTGIMERLAEKGAIDLAEFKILGEYKDTFFLPHSTRLYPEWPFSRTTDTPDPLVEQVLAALLLIPASSNAAIKGKYSGWTVPMDYSLVYDLMQDLHLGPYQKVRNETFSSFARNNWQWFVFIVCILSVSTASALYISTLHRKLKISYENLEIKVQQRTLHLQEEVRARKLAEEEVHREKNNFQNILNSMEDGVYIVDFHYDIQYVNPVLVKDFGAYSGLKCYKYFHNRDEVCPWCKNDDIWAGNRVQWEWTSAYGKTYDMLDTAITLPDGSAGKLEIFRDITKRKKTEAELEMYKNHLETLVKEQTRQLEEKVVELEQMNDVFVGREFRIKELRDRIKELENNTS